MTVSSTLVPISRPKRRALFGRFADAARRSDQLDALGRAIGALDAEDRHARRFDAAVGHQQGGPRLPISSSAKLIVLI